MSATAGPLWNRGLVAQATIVLSVCIGGYMSLVDGPRQQAARARAEAAAIATQLREAEQLRNQVPMFTAARERWGHEAAALVEAGRLAREERELFASIMSIADSSHVTIEQLNPAKAAGRLVVPVADAGADDGGAGDVNVAYSISAKGSYSDVALFLRALRTGLGYSIVRSARITPYGEDQARLVRAEIETEHFAFDPSPPRQTSDGSQADAGGHQ
jgi:hypothetical protein